MSDNELWTHKIFHQFKTGKKLKVDDIIDINITDFTHTTDGVQKEKLISFTFFVINLLHSNHVFQDLKRFCNLLLIFIALRSSLILIMRHNQ